MPKRKRYHKDYDEICRKIKKLERDLHRVRDPRSVEYRDEKRYYEYSDRSDENSIRYESENSLDGDIYGDLPEYLPHEDPGEIIEPDTPGPAPVVVTHHDARTSMPTATPAVTCTITSSVMAAAENTTAPIASCPIVTTNAHSAVPTHTEALSKVSSEALDSSVLEILGEDPSDKVKYGKEIRTELASRLEHIATTGLSKEARKELLDAYPVPENCTKIDAPQMNAEIKAAVTEVLTKRDKGIEARQKQLACAISGLTGVINKELQSSGKDNERLKQLMDVGRLLCDVQHSESVTRRNFVIYSIKKDIKDHVANAKIDKYLFGEDLAETLKTAKAVSKSGTDLKVKSQVRSVKPFTSASNNLNWKAPAPARRQQGPQRNREPAQHSAPPGPSSRHTRAPRHGYSSKTSQPPQRHHRRR